MTKASLVLLGTNGDRITMTTLMTQGPHGSAREFHQPRATRYEPCRNDTFPGLARALRRPEGSPAVRPAARHQPDRRRDRARSSPPAGPKASGSSSRAKAGPTGPRPRSSAWKQPRSDPTSSAWPSGPPARSRPCSRPSADEMIGSRRVRGMVDGRDVRPSIINEANGGVSSRCAARRSA